MLIGLIGKMTYGRVAHFSMPSYLRDHIFLILYSPIALYALRTDFSYPGMCYNLSPHAEVNLLWYACYLMKGNQLPVDSQCNLGTNKSETLCTDMMGIVQQTCSFEHTKLITLFAR